MAVQRQHHLNMFHLQVSLLASLVEFGKVVDIMLTKVTFTVFYNLECFSFFLFSNKMLVIRAGIHKMLVRIANREDLKEQSDMGLLCLSRPFW